MWVKGNITATGNVTAANFPVTSDARLKTDVQEVQDGLAKVLALHPVSYAKKASIEATQYDVHEIGFIAQELQKVLPTLVKEGVSKDKILSVNYNGVIPVLTKAIQEQQKNMKEQQNNIQEQQEIQSLRKELEELKQLLHQKSVNN